MGAYATRSDVYNLALSAQAFVVRPRPFEAVDISTGTIRLTAHGLSADDLVLLVATSGGALPGGTTAFTTYTPSVVASDLFRLVGLSSFSSAGSGWAVSVDPGHRLDMHLLEAAARIDEHLTAEEPPLLVDSVTGKFPQVIVGLNARMAALAAVTSLQIENAAYRVAVDVLKAQAELDGFGERGAIAGTLLGDWKSGKPINPRPTDQNTVADNSARAGSSRAAVGWSTGSL